MNQHRQRRKLLALLLALAMTFSLAENALAAGQGSTYPTTSQEAYERLTALQEEYPEGMKWDNDQPYGKYGATWGYEPNRPPYLSDRGCYITSMRGCAALANVLQDSVFNDAPCYVYLKGQFTYDDIHVGDHLRVYNDAHSVIVWQVTPAGCIIAEGNYGKTVHWGRVMSVDEVEAAAYVVSRWPVGYPKDDEYADEVKPENQGTLSTGLTWQMTNSGTLTISGEGAMPNFDNVNNRAPWADLQYNTVIIEDGITNIGAWAFYGNELSTGAQSNLVQVVIPGTIKVIGANAFRGCKRLISASIPEGIEEIGDNAFRSCASLTSVDLPGSITKLGSSVFASAGVQRVIFANSKPGAKLTIGDGLFAECRWLSYVVLPSNLPRISAGMFQSCNSLFGIIIPKTVTKIENLAFASTGLARSNFGIIYYEGSRNDWYNASDGGTNLAALGIESMGLSMTKPQPNLDVAIANGEIVVNFPFINPFENDGNDLTESTEIAHTHEWVTEYVSDNTYHWHECAAENCSITSNEEKDGYSLHIYENGSDVCSVCESQHQHMLTTTDFWEAEQAGHWRKCTIANCPSEASLRAATIAAHTYDTDDVTCNVCGFEHQHVWSTNSYGYDTDEHWRICTDADCPLGEDAAKNDITHHAYDANDVCVCGAEKPAEETHMHDWSTGSNWSVSDTHHWRTCSDCDAIDHYAEHTYDANGAKCTVCGQEKAIEIEPERHHVDENGDGICDKCGESMPSEQPNIRVHNWSDSWNSDSSHHWHECLVEDCPITNNSEKLGYGEHELGEWIIDTEATATTDGSKHRDCDICHGNRETEVIPALGGSEGPGNSGDTKPDDSGSSKPSTPSTPSRPSSSGGNSGSSNKNPAPTATITNPNSIVKTETIKNADGTSTVIATFANGTTAAITTSQSGHVTTAVKISESALGAAGNQPILLPMDKITVDSDATKASVITISTATNKPAKVTVPTTSAKYGTVIAIVNTDGSTNLVKTSKITREGITATLPSGSTIKVYDNHKTFTDVKTGDWYAKAADFVSARELFAGTTANTFSPTQPMTRAMLMTVLARLNNIDTSGGDTWYAKGMEWAKQNGISDGSNPNSSITREQLITMLWRYVGSPVVDTNLSNFSDAEQINNYARAAMAWGCQNKVINGTSDSRLDPQGFATRAQVAQFLLNFIGNVDL